MGRRVAVLVVGAALGLAGTAQAATQTVTVVNQAHVKPANLRRVELAVQQQALQLRGAWGTPRIRFGKGGWRVYLDAKQDATDLALDPVYDSAMGYHSIEGGAPFAQVVARNAPWAFGGVICPGAGLIGCKPMEDPWTVAFSHEVLEMVADPSTAGREVCDPVGGGSYKLRGVWVSDSATPAWFIPGSVGPWDQMRYVKHAGETW